MLQTPKSQTPETNYEKLLGKQIFKSYNYTESVLIYFKFDHLCGLLWYCCVLYNLFSRCSEQLFVWFLNFTKFCDKALLNEYFALRANTPNVWVHAAVDRRLCHCGKLWSYKDETAIHGYHCLIGFNWLQVVSKKVSSFTVRKGGKFITHNVSYSESELDARLWKKNLKTQWTFTDGGNSRYGNTLFLHDWIPWENLC